MIEILLLFIAAYFANATPVALGGSIPLDDLTGIKLFGRNKTLLGLVSGFSAGTIAAYLIAPYTALPVEEAFFLGITATIGALIGDLLGSMIKRVMGLKEGTEFHLDNVLFIILAMFAVYLVNPAVLDLVSIAVLLVLTFLLHRLANIFAYKLGIKKVPW